MLYAERVLELGGLSGSKRIDNKNRKFYEIRRSKIEENDLIFTLPDDQKVKMPASDGYERIYGDYSRLSESFRSSISVIDKGLTEVKGNIFLSGGVLKIP